MVDYIVLLLFVVFVILWIMDFITTECHQKLGFVELSPLLKYVVGKSIPHAIVRIVVVIFVYFSVIVDVFNVVANPIIKGLIAFMLLLINLGLAYAQITNIKLIRSVH